MLWRILFIFLGFTQSDIMCTWNQKCVFKYLLPTPKWNSTFLCDVKLRNLGVEPLYLEKCHQWWIVGMDKKNAKECFASARPGKPQRVYQRHGIAAQLEQRSRQYRDDTILIKSCQFISLHVFTPVNSNRG